jgi:hypothetical protein
MTTTQQPIVIPMEDELVHTDSRPYCDDVTCPCHDEDDDDARFMETLGTPLMDGLLTPSEVQRLYWGEGL